MESWLHDELAVMGRDHWWYRGRRTILGAVLDTQLPPVSDRHILELGSGTGSVTHLLTRYGAVTGLEPHAGAIEACRAFAPTATIVQGEIGDLSAHPEVHEATFDVVGAFDVIEHIEDDVAALEAMAALVAPDGRLIVTVPAIQMLWGKHDVVNGHYRRYNRSLLVSRLEQSGLHVQYISYFNSILFPFVAGVRLARRLLPGDEREPTSDFTLPARPINDALTRLLGLEATVLRTRTLPIGSSLVAVATC